MTSPTARTLAALKSENWLAQVVEKWIPQSRRRVDLFGIGDVLACRAGQPPLLIQCTSASNIAARRSKALAEPRLRTWLASGATFELWGWAKRGPRGKRKAWTCRREPIGLADLAVVTTADPAPAGVSQPAAAGRAGRPRPERQGCLFDAIPAAPSDPHMPGPMIAPPPPADAPTGLQSPATAIANEVHHADTVEVPL